jgi:S1-C subfamily serine protease
MMHAGFRLKVMPAAALVLALGLGSFRWAQGAAPPAKPPLDPRRDAVVEVVERAMPCVVNIATEEVMPVRDPLENLFREFFDPYYRRRPPNTQFSVGSGVLIDEEGFVLTNFHVVNRARRVWVKFSDGREYEAEKIVGTSFTDVALLRIKAKEGEKFPAVTLAADDDLLLGETVLALGNPFGLGVSVSRGILSSKSRRPPAENEPLDMPDWLQTDAAINPGNSGGPLLNLRGELIGLNVAIYREGQGIGFAVPVKRIAAALAEIYSPEWLEKMWFGARLRPGTQPLVVMSVQADSPAEDAGLRVGDRILELAGKTPKSFVEFNRELLARKRQEISLVVERDRQKRELKLRLLAESVFFNADLVRKKTGLTLEAPTGAAANNLAAARARGLVVADVEPRSPAAEAALAPGMLLTAIDGQAVEEVVTAAKTLHGKTKGQKVRLDLIVPSRRGPIIQLSPAAVEVAVR